MTISHAQRPAAGLEGRKVPTVSRVCRDQTLIELVYDPHARTTALAVSRFGGLWNIEQEVKVETGETLIPYAASNNLIANRCVLLASTVSEYGLKTELLDDIRAFLHRYVDLSPLFEQIAAHYVLLTWVHDAFGELPYLRLRGEYGTGKTRALMAIGSLCYKPFFASGASTVSPLFHTLDAFGGTLILDEADLPLSDSRVELVKILNNGTVKGMPVLRCVPNRYKEYNPRAFRVFGPKIIAMRGSFSDPALESRFLTEETGRRPLRRDIPIHLPISFEDEAQELRNRLLHFRLCELFKIKSDTTSLMEGVAPRINQTGLALLSVVDDPALKAELQRKLSDEDRALKEDRLGTAQVRVLFALHDAFQDKGQRPVPLTEIARRLHADPESQLMSAKAIGHLLRKELNLVTRKTHGSYVVPASERQKVERRVNQVGL